ncbi:MAG: zinc ribbon domain-containing protein [Lachnospiraceae bacterium]|nr:zinc ribbon domain-containing protein [Lachnospiraceae bacterium]
MKTRCLNCKSEYESELGMCPYCGFELESPQTGVAKEVKKYCSRCGKEIRANAKFCHACGEPTDVVQVHTAVDVEEKQKSNRKIIMFGGIAVVIVIALILVVFSSRGSSRTPLSGRYVWVSSNGYSRYLEFTKDGDVTYIKEFSGTVSSDGSYYVEGDTVYIDCTVLQERRRMIGTIKGNTITVPIEGYEMDFIKE